VIDIFSKEWVELMFATDCLLCTSQELKEKSGTIH